MPDGWTLVERAPTAAPPPAPSGWTLVEPAPEAPAPGVFRGTNEKDVAGNAVVREPTADDAGRLMIEREQNRTAADRVVTAMPGHRADPRLLHRPSVSMAARQGR
jgi:hypothetical protein